MSFENKPDTGVLWNNDNKKSEYHPDMKGKFYDKIGDRVVERDIAAWKRRSAKNGTEYWTVKVSDKFVPGNKSHAQASSKEPEQPLDDTGIPF